MFFNWYSFSAKTHKIVLNLYRTFYKWSKYEKFHMTRQIWYRCNVEPFEPLRSTVVSFFGKSMRFHQLHIPLPVRRFNVNRSI